MHYKKWLISIVTLFVTINFSDAQSLLGLSSPIGLMRHGGCSPSMALAGTGTGISNDFLGLTANPANLGVSNRTTFSTGIGSDITYFSDADERTKHLAMNLSVISLSVPLGRYGTIGFAVEPFSESNSQFRIFKKIDIDGILADTAEIGLRQTGGAINWQLGWGYTIKNKVRVGIAGKRLNFNETSVEILRMHGTMNDRFLDSTRTRFTTNGIHAGIQVPVSKFTLGISGNYYLLTTAKRSRLKNGTRDTIDLTDSDRFEIKPPPDFSVGVSCQINPQWLVALDAGATVWDNFYSEEKTGIELRRAAATISAGTQFIPAPNLLNPKFYEVIQYRCGLRYTQLPGPDGYEGAATLSIGLPMQSSGGLFDIIFEYINRKDTRFNDYAENIFSIKLGINGGRKWNQSSDGSY